jgi:hypothetical protein
MEIRTSLDWSVIYGRLKSSLLKLPYNPDLYKMLANIDNMVDALSKEEVLARRINKLYPTETLVGMINRAINHLEKLILVATLMA